MTRKNEIPPITEVKRLRLRPGDILVVRVEQALIPSDVQKLKTLMRRHLNLAEDFPVLILGGGTDIEVVTQ